MPTTLQFRRGTTTQNNAFTGALGEITVDTTVDALRIHDNSTAGGFETVAREAKYADVAERYHADAVYDPGTVVSFGGEKEITKTTTDSDKRVAGVISTDPYAVMNSPHRQPELLNEYHPPIALIGRVPTKVVGTITKEKEPYYEENTCLDVLSAFSYFVGAIFSGNVVLGYYYYFLCAKHI